MPTDYHDEDSLEKYVEVCGKINALVTDCDVADCVVTGDFNCSVGSRLYNNFVDLMSVNKLICTDLNNIRATLLGARHVPERLCGGRVYLGRYIKCLTFRSQAFTYSNSDHCCTSWIDHILCTTSLDRDIIDIKVMYDYISSDHKPLSVKIERVIDSADKYRRLSVGPQYIHSYIDLIYSSSLH